MCNIPDRVPVPPKKYSLEEESNKFLNWCKDVGKIIFPDKPKKLRDIPHTKFKDTRWRKTMLTQIEKVKKKSWWDKIWENEHK